jgi:hypothetical protein
MNMLIRFHSARALTALRLPTAFILLLLQRTPVLRVATAASDIVASSPVGTLVRSALATVAALGAMHSLAGATVLVASQPGPVNVPAGKEITPIGFTVSNTINIASWRIGGTLPPGMVIEALEGGASLTGPGNLEAPAVMSGGGDDPYGYGPTSSVPTTTPVLKGAPSQPGTYTITLKAFEMPSGGGLASDTFNYTITVAASTTPATAPAITTQPSAKSVTVGDTVTFTAAVSGSPAPALQWQKNGTPISGATSATLTLTNVQLGDAGNYTLVATNSAGTATTNVVALAIAAPAPGNTAPAIARQPSPQTVAVGSTVVFSVDASGSPAPQFSWKKNGGVLSGATSATLILKNVSAADAGAYSVVITNSAGTATSLTANLALSSDPNFGHLSNLSVLTGVTSKVSQFAVGAVIGGSGTTGSKPILVRAVGPSLAAFGVGGTIGDPKIDLVSGGVTVGSNDNWNGATDISGAAAQVGAFPFAATTSKDAAILATASSGSYTMQINGVAGSTGTVLAELYDAGTTFNATTPRLINLSVLKQLDAAEILTAGFVIGGTTSRTVLVRAVGPTLGAFGVGGTMSDPKVELYAGSNLLASNDNWGGDPQLNTAASSVGAFPFSDAKDAMLLITLPPGAYSAQVSGANGSSGSALVEVYEVP